MNYNKKIQELTDKHKELQNELRKIIFCRKYFVKKVEEQIANEFIKQYRGKYLKITYQHDKLERIVKIGNRLIQMHDDFLVEVVEYDNLWGYWNGCQDIISFDKNIKNKIVKEITEQEFWKHNPKYKRYKK